MHNVIEMNVWRVWQLLITYLCVIKVALWKFGEDISTKENDFRLAVFLLNRVKWTLFSSENGLLIQLWSYGLFFLPHQYCK